MRQTIRWNRGVGRDFRSRSALRSIRSSYTRRSLQEVFKLAEFERSLPHCLEVFRIFYSLEQLTILSMPKMTAVGFPPRITISESFLFRLAFIGIHPSFHESTMVMKFLRMISATRSRALEVPNSTASSVRSAKLRSSSFTSRSTSTVQSFNERGELPRFGNSRNVEWPAMVKFFRSVKLVRDIGNLGKSGHAGTLDHRASNHAGRALPSSGTKRISTRHFMAAAIRLSISREWPL